MIHASHCFVHLKLIVFNDNTITAGRSEIILNAMGKINMYHNRANVNKAQTKRIFLGMHCIV